MDGGTVRHEPDSSTGRARRGGDAESSRSRSVVTTSNEQRGKRRRGEGESGGSNGGGGGGGGVGGGVSSTGGRGPDAGGRRMISARPGVRQDEKRCVECCNILSPKIDCYHICTRAKFRSIPYEYRNLARSMMLECNLKL